MKSEYQAQLHIPYQPQVPLEKQRAITEELVSTQLSEVRRTGEEAKKVSLINQEYRDQLVNLLGGDNYQKLRAFVKDQKRFKADLFFPPRGPEMSKAEVDQFRREQREKSGGILRELGVEVLTLQSLAKQAADRLQELTPPPMFRDGRRVMIQLLSEVPVEFLAHTHNPWIIVGPPYGWSWWYDGSTNGVNFIPTLHLDAGIGLIGNVSALRDSNASDNDYAHIKFSTAVSFWYQMPTTGLIEVWIEAIEMSCHHNLTLIDEFGWSDSSVNQHNYVTLKASVGGSASELQRAEMSWFTESGHTEGFWDHRNLSDGATYWVNLVSDPSVILPAGSWVLVEVGTLNFHSCLANDVEIYSTMDFSWVIKSVIIRSTGG
jgi:hypothetical protein